MLRTASVLMRVLNVLNWIVVAFFVFMLLLTFLADVEITRKFAEKLPNADPADLMDAVRLLCVLVFVAGPITHVLLTRLGTILRSVKVGDAFIAANGERLRVVAWALLGLQLIDIAFGVLAVMINEEIGETIGGSFSLGGWIAVLLLFVLAKVWTEGAAMRDELEGTV